MREIAEQAIMKINFKVDLDELVENLSVAEKQLIAISRALLNNAKLIIMDEPTSSITKKEVKSLFKVIHQLQEQNIAVLFVSHKLDEVFEIAERFTIFRNGKNVAHGDASELTPGKFTYHMTGRDIKTVPFEHKERNDIVLEIKDLSLKNGFKNVSFSLKKGEILGITGLLGSGRTELVETIFGYNKADSGEIFINGQKAQINSVQSGIRYGIGYVPPERIKEGLFLDQPISDNITIEKWNDFSNVFGVINRKKVDETVDKWVKELSIAIHTPSADVRTLSGGNQQKCVLAKWLLLDLNVLILNGPTVGVDIGAKFDIYEIIKRLAENGLSVIIISDDLPEILSNCSRVLVMQRGELVAEREVSGLEASELAALTAED
jgi:simple sugar transport system ATP-binding protein